MDISQAKKIHLLKQINTMEQIKNIFNKFWIVLLVGMYFILTSIYNELGVFRVVEWSIFIKTTRELFIVFLLMGYLNKLNNSLSILTCLGAVSYSLGLIIFRFYSAISANFDYNTYIEYMKDGDIRNICSFCLFLIFLIIHLINKK